MPDVTRQELYFLIDPRQVPEAGSEMASRQAHGRQGAGRGAVQDGGPGLRDSLGPYVSWQFFRRNPG